MAGGSILGLLASPLNDPDLELWAKRLAIGKEALPAGVGFLLFLGLAYLIYRTALRNEKAA